MTPLHLALTNTQILTPLHLALTNALFWPHCTWHLLMHYFDPTALSTYLMFNQIQVSKCPHELRKHITIVPENLSNVTFVIKYLKENINWESILGNFQMSGFRTSGFFPYRSPNFSVLKMERSFRFFSAILKFIFCQLFWWHHNKKAWSSFDPTALGTY